MSKKGGKASAPDYSGILQQQTDLGREQMAMAREQMAWAREQYARDREVSDKIVNQFLATAQAESQAAAEDRQRYKDVFQPIEDQFVAKATGYDTPERREAEAARAIADVTQQFDASRKAALASLEGYGIDPSMTRSQALDVGVRTAQGAVAAGAANNARRTIEDRGIELTGQAVNLGRGYPAQIAQGYQTAQGAGQGAISGNLSTTGSGAQTMGTGTQWSGLSSGTWGNVGGQVTSQINNANQTNLGFAKMRSDSTSRMLGGITGLLASPMSGVTGSVGNSLVKGIGGLFAG